VCTVQPLTPEGRDELVTNLLRALEPHPRQRDQQPTELIADIRAKEKVDELSRNPLFCTTLVLVYYYQRTALPERRVDVYDELVKLLLGFWETHKAEREGVAEVRELVLQDGTGRVFLDERDAIEAKRRALVELADWMQEQKLAEAPRAQVEARLARFFREREGAKPEEEQAWARNFLAVAHARSGLFIEAQPETYAFSHQNFREYLAATRLIGRRDAAMVQAVADHAADAWWEEVFLLALAYPGHYDEQREYLLECLRKAGHLVLAGRGAVDAGARLPAPLREQIKAELRGLMTDADFMPKERYAAGEVWDELGGLPEDLDTWVLCRGCADGGGDLLAAKYPATNAQFERFIQADGYNNPDYWGGEDGTGWRWRTVEHRESRGKEPVVQPRFWQDRRFDKDRRGYPVVGVSWYEATAYAAWLTESLRHEGARLPVWCDGQLTICSLRPADIVRLPADTEWLRLVGGETEGKQERYPWDEPGSGHVTDYQSKEGQNMIMARANTDEAGLGDISPVAMYPSGRSKPFGLWDVAGNVWEWTNSCYDHAHNARVVRGGSWHDNQGSARPSFSLGYGPGDSYGDIGFRLVSSFGSGF
jgi:formylglycine-generating enzyme required for sulfatase activity